jgi:predicted ferric reductase
MARGAAAPRPRLAGAALVIAGTGLGATTALTITAESVSQLTAAGGLATYAGNLTGMAGTYLALLMVLLVSRIPFIESVFGQDGLLRWHRRLAPWPISLAGTISIRAIRRRIRREIWWTVHLYLYLALAISVAHVIVLGPSFTNHRLTQAVWSVAWATTAGVVLAYRVALPVFRSFRYRLQVAEVRPEAPGVVSITCRGQHLDRLAVSGGQFFFWRFLTRDM